MRKTLFLLVFVYCSSFVNAQSQSIGLNFSYFSHNIFNTHWLNAPDLGVSYNLFFNKQHGVVTGLSINRFKRGFDFTTSDGVLLFIEQKDYNANYSLHYIFKYKQWFAKGGLNLAAFNIYTSTYLDDELSTKSFLESDFIYFVPKIHLGVGRDFDLGKINIRVNGFVNQSFLDTRYFQYGGTVGLFYEFEQEIK